MSVRHGQSSANQDVPAARAGAFGFCPLMYANSSRWASRGDARMGIDYSFEVQEFVGGVQPCM